MHGVHEIQFTSVTPEQWGTVPDADKLAAQIGQAVLAHSELSEVTLGLYQPPKEIREVRLTQAVHDLIHCMWHGHRERGRASPPPIPLKVFVFSYGQSDGHSWVSIEVHPGVDRWDVE